MRLHITLVLMLLSTFSYSQKLEYLSLSIPEELKKNADAVVRLDQMVVNILAQDNMLLQYKRVVTVLNKHGNKHLHAYAGYSNSRKVKVVKAVIYNAFGKEIKKVKEKDFIDVSAVSGGTLYSDSRVKYLDYTPIAYPYTVVFEKEIQTKNTVFIPAWSFLDGYKVSTQKNSFRINFPDVTLKPEILEKNIEGYSIVSTKEPLSILYTASSIPALKPEFLSPVFAEIAPSIMLRLKDFHYEGINGHVENWKQLGSWMYSNILQGRETLPNAVKVHVQNLVKEATTDIEKAKIVYEYMQSVTRYISVQVGIGGIQPMVASEVDRLKYGDCKGLSNYTKSLLNAVGVPSYYVHVEAGKEKISFEENFPTLSQGNHAILAIPNKNDYIFIDCTSQVHPFGFIGDFTDDRKVLIMKPEGGVLVKTTKYLAQDNHQEIKAEVHLGKDGSLEANLEVKTKGIPYDNRFRLEDFDKDKVVEYYQDNWSQINNLILNEYAFLNDKENVEFKETLSISAENFTRVLGDRILFAPNVLNKNTNVPQRYRSRKMPFKISRGYLEEDFFTIQIPEGYALEAFPENTNLSTEFGEYSRTIQAEGNVLTFKRSFFIKPGDYSSEKYNTYRDFRKEVSRNDNSQVSLIKI